MLPPLTTILKSTTQDPTPCLSLTVKLLSPLPLTRTLTIADPPSLITALRSPLPGANLLALAIIHKGAATPGEAALLSTLPDVIEELVRAWLSAADTGVAEKAARVIGDLLETDCEVVGGGGGASHPQVNGVANEIVFPPSAQQQLVRRRRTPGHGRLWGLLFGDRQVFSQILTLCSPHPDRTMNQTTLAQGRLLRLLPRLATLNLAPLSTTKFPDLLSDEGGLLRWAALHMVDATDILMHLNLVDFFETLVSVMRVAETRSGETDTQVGLLVRAAVGEDAELETALRSLANRTVEEEAEGLRAYIDELLG